MKRVHCAVLCFLSDRYKGLTFHLEDGQLIEACGNISVYEQTGTYQMYVRKIELSGAGELYIRYEQLKQELAQKGYFDFVKKEAVAALSRKNWDCDSTYRGSNRRY